MERLLRINEAAKLLSLEPVTLYQMVDRGEIPHLRIGKHNRTIRFELKELEAWLKTKAEKTVEKMVKEV